MNCRLNFNCKKLFLLPFPFFPDIERWMWDLGHDRKLKCDFSRVGLPTNSSEHSNIYPIFIHEVTLVEITLVNI